MIHHQYRGDDPLFTSAVKIVGAVLTALIATVTLENIRRKKSDNISNVSGDPISREFSRINDNFKNKKI